MWGCGLGEREEAHRAWRGRAKLPPSRDREPARRIGGGARDPVSDGLAELAAREAKIKAGNLEAVRDFTDVRDMVKGYNLALEEGAAGEKYNICSGKGYTIKEVLDMLLKMADKDIEIEKDPERMRPSDVPILVGVSSKFRKQTGWKSNSI